MLLALIKIDPGLRIKRKQKENKTSFLLVAYQLDTDTNDCTCHRQSGLSSSHYPPKAKLLKKISV